MTPELRPGRLLRGVKRRRFSGAAWTILASSLFASVPTSAPQATDVPDEDEVAYAEAMAAIGRFHGGRGCVLAWPKERMIAGLREQRRQESQERRARVELHLAVGHVAFFDLEWASMRAGANAVPRDDPANVRARELLTQVELAERRARTR